jgi:hypothetical protein
MNDLLTRSDVLIQELDRRIEAVRARQGSQLAELSRQVEALRESLDALRAETRDRAPAESPTGSTGLD